MDSTGSKEIPEAFIYWMNRQDAGISTWRAGAISAFHHLQELFDNHERADIESYKLTIDMQKDEIDRLTKLQEEKPKGMPFNFSDHQINNLLDCTLKPDEISGEAAVQHDRVRELISWFVRLVGGDANPKWLRSHAFELAYYIATNADSRFIDLEAIRDRAFMEGVRITQAERAVLRIGFPDIPDDLSALRSENERLKGESRQEAIEFAEWKDTNYKRTNGGTYYRILQQMSRFENPIQYLSLEEVYDKYLEHITMLNKKV